MDRDSVTPCWMSQSIAKRPDTPKRISHSDESVAKRPVTLNKWPSLSKKGIPRVPTRPKWMSQSKESIAEREDDLEKKSSGTVRRSDNEVQLESIRAMENVQNAPCDTIKQSINSFRPTDIEVGDLSDNVVERKNQLLQRKIQLLQEIISGQKALFSSQNTLFTAQITLQGTLLQHVFNYLQSSDDNLIGGEETKEFDDFVKRELLGYAHNKFPALFRKMAVGYEFSPNH